MLDRGARLYRGLRRVRSRCTLVRYRIWTLSSTNYLRLGSRISPDLRAGRYCYVGPGCSIGGQVQFGDYVMLAPRVAIIGGDHNFARPGVPIIFAGRPPQQPTVIQSDTWIGFGATVRAGVRIGRGAVVGAGAVVTKDVAPYEIVAGVPAAVVGRRFENEVDVQVHDRALETRQDERAFAFRRTGGL